MEIKAIVFTCKSAPFCQKPIALFDLFASLTPKYRKAIDIINQEFLEEKKRKAHILDQLDRAQTELQNKQNELDNLKQEYEVLKVEGKELEEEIKKWEEKYEKMKDKFEKEIAALKQRVKEVGFFFKVFWHFVA